MIQEFRNFLNHGGKVGHVMIEVSDGEILLPYRPEFLEDIRLSAHEKKENVRKTRLMALEYLKQHRNRINLKKEFADFNRGMERASNYMESQIEEIEG